MYFHFILYLFQVHPFLVVKNSALDFVSLVICEKRPDLLALTDEVDIFAGLLPSNWIFLWSFSSVLPRYGLPFLIPDSQEVFT